MREYTISIGAQLVVGSTTLVFVNPAAAPTANIEMLRYWVGQSANATSAQQRITLATQVTSFPTVVAFTPVKKKAIDAVSTLVGNTSGAAGTCGVNASAEGGGTLTLAHEDAFNVLNGWLMVPTPPETLVYPAGSLSGHSLKFPVIPVTTSGWVFGLTYREV